MNPARMTLEHGAWAVFIVAVLGLAGVLALGAFEAGERAVPSCQEDEIVAGTGDFTSDGFWEGYECVHPDQLWEELYCRAAERLYNDGFWSDGVLARRAACKAALVP